MNVLVIGDVFAAEMQVARRSVESLAETGAAVQFSPMAGISTWPDDRFPELVLVCQLWPDEFTAADVHRLLVRFPLARLICCYGRWCESDGRRRDIWPLSVRVPVRCVPDRIRCELEVIAGTHSPLPLTASRDETFLFDVDGPVLARFAPT